MNNSDFGDSQFLEKMQKRICKLSKRLQIAKYKLLIRTL